MAQGQIRSRQELSCPKAPKHIVSLSWICSVPSGFKLSCRPRPGPKTDSATSQISCLPGSCLPGFTRHEAGAPGNVEMGAPEDRAASQAPRETATPEHDTHAPSSLLHTGAGAHEPSKALGNQKDVTGRISVRLSVSSHSFSLPSQHFLCQAQHALGRGAHPPHWERFRV